MASVQAALKMYKRTSKTLSGFTGAIELAAEGFAGLQLEVRRSTAALAGLQDGIEQFGRELRHVFDGFQGAVNASAQVKSAAQATAAAKAAGPGAAMAGMMKTMGISDAFKNISKLFDVAKGPGEKKDAGSAIKCACCGKTAGGGSGGKINLAKDANGDKGGERDTQKKKKTSFKFLSTAAGMMGSGVMSMANWGLQSEALAQMPMGEVGVMQEQMKKLQDTIGVGLYPAIQAVAGIFTQALPVITQLAGPLAAVISRIAQGAAWLADKAFQAAAVFAENWSWIGPILLGIAAVFGILRLAATAYSAAQSIAAIATGLFKSAQDAANAALLASPLTWILIIIIAVAAAVYSMVGIINKVTGSTLSATGVICGAVNVVWQFLVNTFAAIGNLFTGLWEAGKAIAENIGIAFQNGMIDAQAAWLKFVTAFQEGILDIAQWLNETFGFLGLELDVSGIKENLEANRGKIEELLSKKQEYQDVGAAFDRGNSTYEAFQEGWMENAYNQGYQFGEGLENSAKDYLNNFMKTPEIPGAGISAGAGATGDYSARAEDMAYMRDIAEREAVNRYATSNITINQNNENHISKDVDLDGITDAWTVQFAEKLDVSAEGALT